MCLDVLALFFALGLFLWPSHLAIFSPSKIRLSRPHFHKQVFEAVIGWWLRIWSSRICRSAYAIPGERVKLLINCLPTKKPELYDDPSMMQMMLDLRPSLLFLLDHPM